MNAQQLINLKVTKAWPESLQIFEDSCVYSIENNLDFLKGVLLHRESPITHQNSASISEQLQGWLAEQGYNNNLIWPNYEHFHTMKGHESGMVFVAFLSNAGIKAYLAENDKWGQWAKQGNTVLRGEEPKRPIYEEIRYLDIYKGKRGEITKKQKS